MTIFPSLDSDVRVVTAALVANQAIVRPATITATGREAPSQHARILANGDPQLALMPDVDYDDQPDARPASGFVGGRLSSFVPYLAPGTLVVPPEIMLRDVPSSREAILRRLRASAGLHWAPGSLFALVGWEDEAVAAWLDRFRENGDEARLNIALAQAMLAKRKMWLEVIWHPTPLLPKMDLPTRCGAAAVGRALIDVVAVLGQIQERARTQGATTPHTDTAMVLLLTCLHNFLRHLIAADRTADPTAMRRKLIKAFDWARKLLGAIGTFAVAPEALGKRWFRLVNRLTGIKRLQDHAGSIKPELDRMSRQLERLSCAAIGNRLEATCWRSHIRRSLLRLGNSDRQIRLIHLERVRGDLMYKLAITGRLDRLYELFPWLAAPHAGFPGCAGGALGALASLLECGRAMQVNENLKHRLEDLSAGLGTVQRLTIPNAKAILNAPLPTFVSVNRSHVLGQELVRQNISFRAMEHALAGVNFGKHSLLAHARRGRLSWNDAKTFKDRTGGGTLVTVITSGAAFASRAHDDDLPRYMGMTPLRLINAAIHSIFPTAAHRTDLTIHRTESYREARLSGHPEAVISDVNEAKVAMQNSMLLSLDRFPDRVMRDSIADASVPHFDNAVELKRAESLQTGPTRKSAKFDEHIDGQGRRRTASKEAVNAGERGRLLRTLANDAGRWRRPKNDEPAPNDDLLEDLLRGIISFRQPVSDLFVPILWFAPCIDRHLLGWFGRGAHLPTGVQDPRFNEMRQVFARVREWGPMLFESPLVTDRNDQVLCHLFTGVSPLTSDLSHVR